MGDVIYCCICTTTMIFSSYFLDRKFFLGEIIVSRLWMCILCDGKQFFFYFSALCFSWKIQINKTFFHRKFVNNNRYIKRSIFLCRIITGIMKYWSGIFEFRTVHFNPQKVPVFTVMTQYFFRVFLTLLSTLILS